ERGRAELSRAPGWSGSGGELADPSIGGVVRSSARHLGTVVRLGARASPVDSAVVSLLSGSAVRTPAPLLGTGPIPRRDMPSTLPGVPDIDDQLATSIVERLGTVEHGLRESVASSDDMMRWTARHLMDAGGKRVRPMLVLLAASLGDVDAEGVQEAAILVE